MTDISRREFGVAAVTVLASARVARLKGSRSSEEEREPSWREEREPFRRAVPEEREPFRRAADQGRAYRYVHLDVFTDRRMAGNQLLVYTDPAGLDTDAMQRFLPTGYQGIVSRMSKMRPKK